jgi:hypothetical protein
MKHPLLSRYPVQVGPNAAGKPGGSIAAVGRCITWHVAHRFAVDVDQSRPNPRYTGAYQRGDVFGSSAGPAKRRFALCLN